MIISACLLLLSCEENISYLGQFKQQYSLNCVLRSDRDIQIASILRSYAPGEINPVIDVRGAEIKLILPDTTLEFKDSILASGNSGTSKIGSFYYLKNYRLKKNTEIKIEAFLSDGTVLASKTRSPSYFSVLLPELYNGPSIIPDQGSATTYQYRWEIYGNSEPVVFGPSFYIKYYSSGDEGNILYKKVTGRRVPFTNAYRVQVESIDNAMLDISSGILDKENINIVGACFEVKVFDKALGVYVSSIQTFDDEFSIRVSEPDIGNINGGYGIFGTYISEQFDLFITPSYIRSFGYTPAP